MDNKFSLQVKTDLDVLPSVLAWFNENYPVLIPGKIWIQCQTALAEGLTNAIRHAHRNLAAETPILIEVEVVEQSLEMRIWDRGPAFDLQHQLATLAEVIDREQVGGRGLRLIQRLCDDFSYSRLPDGRNCLLLVKYFTPVD